VHHALGFGLLNLAANVPRALLSESPPINRLICLFESHPHCPVLRSSITMHASLLAMTLRGQVVRKQSLRSLKVVQTAFRTVRAVRLLPLAASSHSLFDRSQTLALLTLSTRATQHLALMPQSKYGSRVAVGTFSYAPRHAEHIELNQGAGRETIRASRSTRVQWIAAFTTVILPLTNSFVLCTIEP
jgi:hypothetical protein